MSAVKSYADATCKQAALAQSSKNVVESVIRKLDADKVEREKRQLNVCILNVPDTGVGSETCTQIWPG